MKNIRKLPVTPNSQFPLDSSLAVNKYHDAVCPFLIAFFISSVIIVTNEFIAADELNPREVAGQAEQFIKEEDVKKYGFKAGDERKAVTEAEKIVGRQTHTPELASDPPITKELMAELYKRHPRPTQEELAVAEAEKIFADTKGRLQHPEIYRKTLSPEEQLSELEHQINKLWLRMYGEYHIGQTKPQRLLDWLKLKQEYVETTQQINPDPMLADEADFYSKVLAGGNSMKVGYCYLMEAEAAEEAGNMALKNDPKFKGVQEQALIWQNMGKVWSENPKYRVK